eukprot:Colp12_sorted_trinity150504_noHs@7253
MPPAIGTNTTEEPSKALKSCLKKPSGAPKIKKTVQSEKEKLKVDPEVEKAIRHQVAVEKATFELQLSLSDTDVTEKQLIEAGMRMRPVHYAAVVEEREAGHLCGYPLCNNKITPKMTTHPVYKLSRSKGQIYEVSESNAYCSQNCYAASKYLSAQLSDTVVWLRDFTKIEPPKLLPRESWKTDTSVTMPVCVEIEQRSEPQKGISISERERTVPSAPTPSQASFNSIEGYTPAGLHGPEANQAKAAVKRQFKKPGVAKRLAQAESLLGESERKSDANENEKEAEDWRQSGKEHEIPKELQSVEQKVQSGVDLVSSSEQNPTNSVQEGTVCKIDNIESVAKTDLVAEENGALTVQEK